MHLPVKRETRPVHRRSITVCATMAVAGLLLGGCASRLGQATQPNMRYLVPVNHTLPPELTGTPATTSTSPSAPSGQAATP